MGAAVVVVTSEVLHWRASRSVRRADGACAVIVLGYGGTRRPRPHPVERWRVGIAARTVDEGCLILSGGPTYGGVTEAARLSACVPADVRVPVLLEERASSTIENVAFALPLAESYPAIAFASDPMHAARARRVARTLRPDLADRFVGADDYRVLERWWLKVPTAVYEVLVARKARIG